MVLSIRSGGVALVALLFIAFPAYADEIEPEPEPAPRAEPEPEPETEPASAVASEEEVFSEPAWIPSIEVGFEAYSYDVDSTVINLTDPTRLSETQPEEPGQILFRIGGELMGPMFEDLPGRPRLFVQGGVGIPTFDNERIFEIGNPDDPAEPEAGIARYESNGPGQRDLPSDFEGQGTWIDADIEDWSWYAGLGIAFNVLTTDALSFHVKPSVQYAAEKIDFTGKLKTVHEPIPRVDPPNCNDPGGVNRPPGPPCVREFEILESNAEFDTTDHSIGPGLEVAMGFLSSRPVRISLFAQIRALWLISGKTNGVTGAAGLASYSVERDGFVFRGGMGARLSWVGFD